jgi:hypothetical protein
MKPLNVVVQQVLAHRANQEATAILPSLHLQRDLHLRPLELALVALDLEDIVHVELPYHAMASMGTVGELVSFLSSATVRSPKEY